MHVLSVCILYIHVALSVRVCMCSQFAAACCRLLCRYVCACTVSQFAIDGFVSMCVHALYGFVSTCVHVLSVCLLYVDGFVGKSVHVVSVCLL